MAIRRMISKDPEDFRRFQADMIPLGKIRTGIYATPAGKRGRPEKLDRFRFTSPDRDLIEAVAAEYGGEARPWSPDKDPNRKEFEVVTDTDELDVLLINGQRVDPTYEAWAAGRTCVRRCDGVWDMISQAPCLCNGPDKPTDPQKLCKITTRVRVMLRRVAGVGSWMYESHGEYFATETGGLMAELVARASVPVPSLLRLELERRREPDREKGGFKTKEFYVARFRTTAATPQQALSGGDMLTQALTGAPVREIESAPVVATPAPPSVVIDIEGVRPAILADIEAQTTTGGLDAIRDKLIARGIGDQRVKDAWASKMAGLQAAAQVARPYRVLVTGSRTWTDVPKLDEALSLALMTHRGRMVLVHGACPTGADAQADEWARKNGVPIETHPADWSGQGRVAGFKRNQAMVDTKPDVVLAFIRQGSKGATHCAEAADRAGLKVLRYVDDAPVERKPCLDPYCGSTETPCGFTPNQHMEAHGADAIIEADRAAGRIPDYKVDDTVTVGDIEFTKVREMPNIEDMLFGAQQDPGEPVDGTVETTPGRVTLPDVPEGDYDADELYTMLMTGAGQQAPPLTTGEVNRLILNTFPIEKLTDATGHDLARLRAGLKSGAVAWR